MEKTEFENTNFLKLLVASLAISLITLLNTSSVFAQTEEPPAIGDVIFDTTDESPPTLEAPPPEEPAPEEPAPEEPPSLPAPPAPEPPPTPTTAPPPPPAPEPTPSPVLPTTGPGMAIYSVILGGSIIGRKLYKRKK